MKSIVSNATPLIYLAKIGRLYLLKEIFGEVLIPKEVKREVVDEGKKLGERDAYIAEKAITEGWIKLLKAEGSLDVPIRLEAGEIAVLSLAKTRGIKEVLVDESSARMAARLVELTPRGTIFVLLKALEINKIDMNEFIDSLSKLIKQGFRLREEVYLEAIKRAREIDEKNEILAELLRRGTLTILRDAIIAE